MEEPIVVVRLITGEELIAKLGGQGFTADGIVLSKPRAVVAGPDGNAGLMDFLMLIEEEEVLIPIHAIVFTGTAKEGLAKGYKEAVWQEKQIVQPSKKIVLPE